jgi:hypothetical protein
VNTEKEIDMKENELRKCEREMNETVRDEALPEHKKRKRRRNEEALLHSQLLA